MDRRISNNTVNTHEVTQELGPKQQEHVFSASGSGQSLEQSNYNCSADHYFIKGGGSYFYTLGHFTQIIFSKKQKNETENTKI